MRLRTWTAIIALLGVVLHAAAVVRHHGLMLDAHLEHQTLVAGLAATFCHDGGTGAEQGVPPGLPDVPSPHSQGDCPDCCGLGPAFTVAAPVELNVPIRFAAMARWCDPERINPALRYAVCPPPRGPPALAA